MRSDAVCRLIPANPNKPLNCTKLSEQMFVFPPLLQDMLACWEIGSAPIKLLIFYFLCSLKDINFKELFS